MVTPGAWTTGSVAGVRDPFSDISSEPVGSTLVRWRWPTFEASSTSAAAGPPAVAAFACLAAYIADALGYADALLAIVATWMPAHLDEMRVDLKEAKARAEAGRIGELFDVLFDWQATIEEALGGSESLRRDAFRQAQSLGLPVDSAVRELRETALLAD